MGGNATACGTSEGPGGYRECFEKNLNKRCRLKDLRAGEKIFNGSGIG
jgi:hypothetical protein